MKFFGSFKDAMDALWYILASIVFVLLYNQVAVAYLPQEYWPGLFDSIGTVTGLACVLLTRKQNIWCWPLGIISSICMGIFFFNISLPGQVILQLAYFTPIQFLGWYQWLYGGDSKTGLEPKYLQSRNHYVVTLVLFIGLTVMVAGSISMFAYSQYVVWDASILAASIIAQTLLSYKKVEAWYIWCIPVNISSIGLYVTTGAWLFAVLYIVFLVNAFYALWLWHNEARSLRRVNIA